MIEFKLKLRKIECLIIETSCQNFHLLSSVFQHYEIERSYDFNDICKHEGIIFVHRGCMLLWLNFETTAKVNNTDNARKP